MGLKEIYSSIEEKYYKLMDTIDSKGIPIYKAIDFFESKSIPSFPIAILFVLLILSGIIFLLVPGIVIGTTDFTITITDGTENLQGVTINYLDGNKTIIATTNSEGKAVIKVKEGEFTLTAEKNGYKKGIKKFDTKDGKEGTIELKLSALKPISVQLLGTGNEILDETITVSFTCSGNDEWSETITFQTGSADLEDVPANCNKIIAHPIGKDCSGNCDFDSEDSLIKIFLENTTTEKGRIVFTVTNETGTLQDGINVKAIPIGSTIPENYCSTYNGDCETELSFGEYYIRATDSLGQFKDYDSKDLSTTILLNSSNQIVYFDIELEEGVIGEIKIKVKSEDSSLIENALVRLFKDDIEKDQQRTNEEGIVVFNVGEQIDYTVSVTHPDYLNSDVKTVSPSSSFYEFTLKEATPSNKRKIEVTVTDEKGEPVENTKVFLKDAITGSIIGQEKETGFDGKASFERMDEGKYVVRAEKRGFEGKNSTRVIEVKENELSEITIALNIGQGILDVLVVDKEKQPIQSATVKLIDYFTGKEYSVDSTDTEGRKSFNVRADKKVYLEVSESTHSNYISAPIQMFDGTEEKTITLEDSINEFGIKLEELSLQGMEVENTTVSQGKTYTAKFKLMIPKGTFSNNAGVHIRTGADTTNQNNTMEKDDLYIKSISASNTKIVKGTTFNPNTGYGIDSTHLTSGNSKWANITFNSVKEGTYEIEAVIQVKESLNGGPMEIAYRAWIEAGEYQRDPFDEELQGSESTTTKQSIYAKTRHEPLNVGSSSLCAENFCTSFRVKDLQNATTTNIIDSFPAEISSDYELEFNIISISEKTYSESELAIEGNGIEINSFEIDAKTQEIEKEKIVMETGSITKGEKISGKVSFTTKKEGTNRIDFSLFGETFTLGKEKILYKPIRAEVRNAKTLKIDTSPKNLVPFIKNNLLVHLTDEEENELNEVEVKIEKDEELITSGKTDSKGIFAYSFESMAPGTEIKITAQKNGYNPIEKTMKIQENIFNITPTEITETFNAKKDYKITRDLTLQNTTEMPLTIKAIELTNSFEGLITGTIADYAGREITMGNSEQILVTLGMTEKGKQIKELTSLQGEIIIAVENLDAGKEWISTIPIKITIGLGGEVDSTDCFTLSPNTWTALTEDSKRELKLVLANTCTIEGEEIALKNIKAKVVWKENAIGSFDLTSSLDGMQTERLSNQYKVIAETFNPNSGEEENLSLSFIPDDIALGSGQATIYIEAINPTENGEQQLKQKIEVKTEISQLSECLRIMPTTSQLRIQMNGYNYGYGNMQNYFGYNPQNTYSWAMDPSYMTSMGRNYAFNNGPYDPTASIGSLRNNSNVVFPSSWQTQQYPQNYYNAPYSNPTGFDNSLNYNWNFGAPGTATIEIQNNCPSTVQIELEGASEISVSDSTIVLTSGDNKSIEVTPNIFIGQYPLTIRAKHKDSTDAPREIAKFNVLVESELMRNYYDCITLNKKVFTFNDIIQKPVEGIVWNTCYDLGIRLTQQSVPTSLDGTSTQNYNWGSDYKGRTSTLKSSGVIDSIQIIGLFDKPGSDGKMMQELKFRMRKNINYLPSEMPDLNPQNPLEELANMRIKLTGAYYTIESEDRLPVTFYDRTGMQQIIPFDIIIEDVWAGLGIAGDFINFGDPTKTAQECIDEKALMFCNHTGKNGTNDQGQFPEALFENGISKYIDAQQVIIKDKSHCADADSISRIINSTIEDKSGVILKFYIEGSDKIKMTIDKSNATNIPKEIKGEVLVRLSRTNPMETKTVTIPFHICLEGLAGKQKECYDEAIDELTPEKIKVLDIDILAALCIQLDLDPDELKAILDKLKEEETPIGSIKTCKNGVTGTTAFEAYGFDKIKFKWNWDAITETECDSGNDEYIYCDATQFAIELSKKAEKIEELKLKANGKCLTGEHFEADCEKTAENAYRFVLEQIEVQDDEDWLAGSDTVIEKYVFFVDGTNSIIKGTPIDLSKVNGNSLTGNYKTIQDVMTAGLKFSNAETVTGEATTIINEIKDDKEINENRIVGEINATGWSSNEKEILKKIGADQLTSSKYVMTFNEYNELRDKLLKCIETATVSENDNPTECTIEVIAYHRRYDADSKPTVTIDFEFLNKLQKNIEFKAGILNEKDLSDDDKKILLEYGEIITEIENKLDEMGYDSFEEFYKENIEFSSYLKYDALSKDFREDFEDTYGNNRKLYNVDDWKVNTGDKEKFESGKHKILFNYDWSGEGKNTKLTITKTEEDLPAKYKENYLFSVPFDGKVGINKTLNRPGYGTYFDGETVGDIYLNNEGIILQKGGSTKTGLNKFTKTSLPDTFESTRTGRILYMDNDGEFTFTPSKPLGLKAELESTGTKGVFYDLLQGNKQIGIDQEKGLNYLFKWNSIEDDFQKESDLKKGDTKCSDTRFGIIFKQTADKIQTTLSFVPVSLNYIFQEHCNTGISKLTGYEFTYKAGKPETHSLSGTESFDSTEVKGKDIQNANIEYWVNAIKSDNVCFIPNKNEFTLEWNKEELIKELN